MNFLMDSKKFQFQIRKEVKEASRKQPKDVKMLEDIGRLTIDFQALVVRFLDFGKKLANNRYTKEKKNG